MKLPIMRHWPDSAAYQLKIRPDYWVLFFVLIGFGLRLQKLSFQPLWGDEGWSFYFANQSLAQLLALTAVDIHPPLYYILLKGWLLVIGTGAEEARFFSVIIGLALIPVMAALGRRLFNTWAGVMAAAVTALMPMAIYYSQEVRMYGLVTLLGASSIYFFIKIEEADYQQVMTIDKKKRVRHIKLLYTISMVAALYTHYYAVFIAFAQMIYLFLVRLIRRSPTTFSRFAEDARLTSFIYVGLLYLPWVIYAGTRLVRYVENKRGVEGYVPLGFLQFWIDHIVAFSLGHIADNLADYRWAALTVVVAAVLGLIATLNLKNKHTLLLYLYLLAPLFFGYLINLFYPFTPRFFERTLLLAAPAYWLLVGIGLIWLWDRHYLLVITAATMILLVINVSLNGFYAVLRYPHEDYRPLLGEIAARTMPEDTVLASYQWQLGYYHAYLPAPHPKFFPVPGWGKGWSDQETGSDIQLVADLERIFEQSDRLWFPAYQASGHIWEDKAETAIATLGYPALLKWYSPQTKLTLAGAAHAPFLQPVVSDAKFEDRLILVEANIGLGQYQAGRQIVPVELVWQKINSLGSNHSVSLRLTDAVGRTWTTRDSYPRAGQVFFTDMNIGDTIIDRHGLLTPAGAPPGSYRLLLSIRRVSDAHPLDLWDEAGQPQGVELVLAEVNLIMPDPPIGKAVLPIQTAVEADFDHRIQLVGYSLGSGHFKAGENLPLTLFWQSLADNPGGLTVAAELQDDDGQVVASFQRDPIRPTSTWQQGDLLRDPQEFILPPTLAPGEYNLILGLLSEQKPLEVNGKHQLYLEKITTVDRPHTFDLPEFDIDLDLGITFGEQAQLVGLDLPRTRINKGESLPLTLYWQALTTFEKSWTVFVHLVNNKGHIVSQQDQIPGAGQFPTTGWVPGEYLVDTYNLVIPPDIINDNTAFQLKIGMYDANDFKRLPVMEGGQIINDHITLESWPILIE